MPEEKRNGSNRGVGLTSDQRNQSISEMIARHVVQLSEHVDSIQIIATKLEPNGTTIRIAHGSGDLYARVKAIEMWADQVEAGLGGE